MRCRWSSQTQQVVPGEVAVKIAVTFIDAALTLAAVHIEPSLLERILFGATVLDDMVVGRPAPGGGRTWLHDSTGRRVQSNRIVNAIERARFSEIATQLLSTEARRSR